MGENRDDGLHGRSIDRSVISEIGSRIFAPKTPRKCGRELVFVYPEAFSDLQMIFLTHIGYVEYLKGFLYEKNLDLKGLSERMEGSF